jgi:ATP-dependent DNA helicase PIF1
MDSSQQHAFERYISGKSICVTGPAGTGKSFLIKRFVAYGNEGVALTATTGTAAVLLGNGAKTLHSWAGIGLGNKPVDVLVSEIRKFPPLVNRWRQVKTLIIDESSMLTAELFEKIEQIARSVRFNNTFFGGIQLVLVGDFYQLPPVGSGTKYCFESPLWQNIEVVQLNTIWRQTDDVWKEMLNEIRIGKCSEQTHSKLIERMIEPDRTQPIQPTKLYCRRLDVDAINQREHDKLEGTAETWTRRIVVRGITSGLSETLYDKKSVELQVAAYERNAQYYETLHLKPNDQVMLIANLATDIGLCNGSRGVVTRIERNVPYVRFLSGLEMPIDYHEWEIGQVGHRQVIFAQQIPLRLAYAITIHKSQGMTMDCAEVDIGSAVFEHGQTYVALSRVKSLDGLYLMGLDPSKIKVDPRVKTLFNQTDQT